jgi:DNA-binding MarR family transcriptional regulator
MEVQTVDHRSALSDELGGVLARLYGFLRRGILLPDEMSLTQALVLSTLRDRGPQRVTDLADIEGIRQPTCTGLVNTMEAEGWVARTVDPSDRRAVVVELTSGGRAVLEEITNSRSVLLDRYLSELGNADRQALTAALPSLQRIIELGMESESTSVPSRAGTKR